ncbi:HupE/UreJ family protein [Aquincola sp. MAHUQ-54]|uniref:HupE/UreJ family protein n=1 Tax=Aquincola agrisoli TaxID=3119538 RepID=A0AAW9Q710_9BURK
MNALWKKLCLAGMALMALLAATASAHELSMAEMALRETSRGEFTWQWTARERATTRDINPVWPAGCTAEGNFLHCGPGGLQGTLSVDGVGKRYSAAIVKIQWLDGQTRVYTLTSGQPTVQLYGAADDERGVGEIASAYTLLGIEHILTGTDHLIFVISLLFLVGFNRRLVWTITAFTGAHSITLALSALGLLTLRPPPVEAAIALSIMLVAGEALHKEATLSRRWPALVAFLFGLVHGLGFAGALKQIGMPEQHLPIALLTFNVGVEIGQLAVVLAAWVVYKTLSPWPRFAQARTPSLYAIGSVAVYWACGRIFAIVA